MKELKVFMEEEELKPGAEIPTPAGIRFYPCENCLFNNCEVYLSPDIPDHEGGSLPVLVCKRKSTANRSKSNG